MFVDGHTDRGCLPPTPAKFLGTASCTPLVGRCSFGGGRTINQNVSAQRHLRIGKLEDLLKLVVKPFHQLSSELVQLLSGNCFCMIGWTFHAFKVDV